MINLTLIQPDICIGNWHSLFLCFFSIYSLLESTAIEIGIFGVLEDFRGRADMMNMNILQELCTGLY